LLQQLAMVQRTILRLAFPGGATRSKPGPYRGGGNGATAEPSATVSGRAPKPGPTGADGSGPEQRSGGVRFKMPERR
jgi:linoleoyl-CoA desaturase